MPRFHVLGRWRGLAARAGFVLWFLVALAFLCLPLALSIGCSRPKPVVPFDNYMPSRDNARSVWGIPYPRLPGVAGMAPVGLPNPETKPPADIGKEAAKRSIEHTAVWVGRMGYFTVAAAILLGIFAALRGGLSFGRPLGVAGVGAACLFARFFLLAHGYFVSESISWALMLALFGAMAIGVWMLGHWLWERRTGIRLAEKAVARGVVGVDALAKLPIRQKARSKLADAWTDFIADPPISRFSPSLFVRHNLPLPKSGG